MYNVRYKLHYPCLNPSIDDMSSKEKNTLI